MVKQTKNKKRTNRKPLTNKSRTKKNSSSLCEQYESVYSIKTQRNELLVGKLHEPKKPSPTLIITLHGFLSNKNQLLLRQLCTELARAGYNAYRFDFSGNADSEGRFEDNTPKKMFQDIHEIIVHFREKKIYEKILLLGHSLGGTLALITASRFKIDAVIAIAAPMHTEQFEHRFNAIQRQELARTGMTTLLQYKNNMELPYTITTEFIHQMKELHPLAALKDIHCPVFVIQGTNDRVVQQSNAEELIYALFHKELLLIGGANHLFSNPEHLDAILAGVIAWVAKQK